MPQLFFSILVALIIQANCLLWSVYKRILEIFGRHSFSKIWWSRHYSSFMALTLDELFGQSITKRRKLLDLSKVKIECYEDYVKYEERLPEMKMRPETVDVDELCENWNNFSFAATRKEKLELDSKRISSDFRDPMPKSMEAVRMDDLLAVDIHWKMLTDLRPTHGLEEDFFNRLMDMGKLRRSTKLQEAKLLAAALSNVPGSSVQAKFIDLGFYTTKSKKGTVETKIKMCRHCNLELCNGAYCKLGHYEFHSRVILDKDELEAEEAKGFSLKAVISEATRKPDAKAEDKKVRERRQKQKGPSLKAMINKAKPNRKKRQKNKKKQQTEEKAL